MKAETTYRILWVIGNTFIVQVFLGAILNASVLNQFDAIVYRVKTKRL